MRGVAQHTQFISADLSGGFDSRISLVTLLNSGIDLNNIRIFSVHAKRHTYAEDYATASQIAEHYGFKLNQPLPQSQFLNYSLIDVFNFNQYCGRNAPEVLVFFTSGIYEQSIFRNQKNIFFQCGGGIVSCHRNYC